MNEITYSFIIPHRNTPNLLIRCLDSIPQRDDVEIIIVDNNSCPDIVDFDHYPGCSRSDVTVIQDNTSIGAGGARNTGLANARGKWVLFADADDYYSESFFDKLDLYKDSDFDVVYFNTCVDEECHSNIESLKYRITVPWNKMTKRAFLIQYSIQFEDCQVGNDVFYSYQVGYFSKSVACESSLLYIYAVNNDSVTHRRVYNKEYYCCLFRHVYQCNAFRNFIGHSEWNRSVGKKMMAILVNKGLFQFVFSLAVYCSCYFEIILDKDYFVNCVKDHERVLSF